MTTDGYQPETGSGDEDVRSLSVPADEAGRLTVDLGAVISNYRRLQTLHPASRIGAVVKADAYGLGAAVIAPALASAGCRDFFVAHASEAIALQPFLNEGALYVLNGLAPGWEDRVAATGIIPVLNSLDQANRWYAAALSSGRRLPAVLQFDTGMSRLGIDARELDELLSWPDFSARVDVRMVMSHMACADTPGAPANQSQIDRFREFSARLPEAARSLANSAAALFLPEAAGDVIRPGLVLYGIDPGEAGETSQMQAAVRLEARIVQLRDVPAGAGIGYGHDYIADKACRVATISAGYADGWPRALSGKGAVWFNGVRLPLLGRVSMDSCMADVSALPRDEIKEGDRVELIGPHQSVSDLANLIATTPHEILTGLGQRYTRIFLNSPSVSGQES